MPSSSRPPLLGSFALIAIVIGVGAAAFAYTAGWFSPQRLTPDKFVAAFAPPSGVALGHRRNHAKGICFTGIFEANGAGSELSQAQVFSRGEYPVLGRFNLGTADPNAPDATVRVRGLGIRISTPDGQEWRSAMIDPPFFPVSTPQAFYALLRVSGSKEPDALPAFAAAHPEFAKFGDWAKSAPWTGSYAEERFNGVNSFISRDRIERQMAPAQIAEAQKFAREWKVKPEETPGRNLHYGEIADPSVWPISAVGVVTVALNSNHRGFCTGTLVAPKLVLTAAHCLFNNKQLETPGNVRFLAGLNKGIPAAYSVAERLVVSKEFEPGPWTIESSPTDWAVVVLREALSIRPVSVKSITRERFDTVSKSGSALQVGYGRDRPYLPSIVHDCFVTEGQDDRTFMYRCLTNFGYSGAPILVEIDGAPSVIGIASASQKEERRGIACSASQFERTVTQLMQSE